MKTAKTGCALALLAIAPWLIGCDSSSSRHHGSSAAAATSSTPTPIATSGQSGPSGPAPLLERASFADVDGSGTVTAGDQVTLWFDTAVTLNGPDAPRDLALTAGDTVGGGATMKLGQSAQQVVVELGTQPTLSLVGTYLPGQAPGAGKTPATVALHASRQPDAIVGPGGAPAQAGSAVAIVLADQVTYPAYQGQVFRAPAKASTRAYFGNLHAHTDYSDGKETPAFAHAHARNAGLDFQVTTDHLEYLTPAQQLWAETERMMLREQRPTFLTHRGFEWGHGYIPPLRWYNHANIIGTPNLIPLGSTLTVKGFYRESLDRCYPHGAVGQFNHPYINKPPLVYDQWDSFAYDIEADKLMALMRCDGTNTRQTPQLGYLPALEKGWHVSPTSNQDNHSRDWGTKNDRRTGVWMPALTRPELLRALREGRVFATEDKNATARLLANGDVWMGSTVAGPGRVALRVEFDDPDQEGFAKVDIVSNGQVVHTQVLNGTKQGAYEVTVDPQTDAYFYAHITQSDGNELFTTPIYVDR